MLAGFALLPFILTCIDHPSVVCADTVKDGAVGCARGSEVLNRMVSNVPTPAIKVLGVGQGLLLSVVLNSHGEIRVICNEKSESVGFTLSIHL